MSGANVSTMPPSLVAIRTRDAEHGARRGRIAPVALTGERHVESTRELTNPSATKLLGDRDPGRSVGPGEVAVVMTALLEAAHPNSTCRAANGGGLQP